MSDIKWASIIRDLEMRGWRQTEIAEAVGLRPSSLSDIKNGRSDEPTGTAAVKLHELHRSKRKPPRMAAA